MKTLFFIFFISFSTIYAQVTEYKIITSVESIVPMGLGRSRIIEGNQMIDHTQFEAQREEGKRKKNNAKREDLKIDNFKETKLLNFFSGGGINFQNIASNDAMLTSMMNNLSEEGWKLSHVVTGVESHSGEKDRNGLFITRYFFERNRN